MSRVEIAILIVAAIIPVMSILFIVPKRKKKADKPKTQTLEELDKKNSDIPKLEELKKEEAKLDSVVDNSLDGINPNSEFVGLNDADFEAYLRNKAKRANKPRRFGRNRFPTMSLDEFDIDDQLEKVEKPKADIKSQWENLTPEMKAIIISNVFDRKY